MKKRRKILNTLLYLTLVLTCMSIIVGCTKKNDHNNEKIQQNVEQNVNADNDSQGKSGETKEVKIYYVEEKTGEVTGKIVTIKDENDIWSALQENGILTSDCRLLNFKVNEEKCIIDLDFNVATGERIRNMGTTGETQIIGCIINTYLEAYNCDGIKLTEEGQPLETSHGATFDGYSGIISF